MKALLIKDLYTITRQMKILLLLIVFFAIVPGYSMSGFAIIYTAMLPVTAMAYDERSKWNKLVRMMPYSTWDIVLGKYVFGYIGIGAAGVLCAGTQLVLMLVGKVQWGAEGYIAILLTMMLALLMQAVILPFMFGMGVEKGRMIFLAVVAVFVIGTTAFGQNASSYFSKLAALDVRLCAAAAVLLAGVCAAASMLISKKLLEKQ